MLIKEFRVLMPVTVEEYRVAQLWSVAEASKNETGGGEGVEVLKNHPFENEKYGKGQYTYKIYHMDSRVPSFAKKIAPKGSLEFHEEAWNAFPYCRTVITNPDYMQDNFMVSIETWHKQDFGETENVHKLPPDEWKKTEVIHIDIANNVNSSGYNLTEEDPQLFTPKAEGRGPLTKDWIRRLKNQENGTGCEGSNKMPHMCAYKLVRCNFKWLGLQNMVEKFVHKQEKNLFTNFHRQVYCWMDKWYGLTIEDIRKIEDQVQEELGEMRSIGTVRGTKVTE